MDKLCSEISIIQGSIFCSTRVLLPLNTVGFQEDRDHIFNNMISVKFQMGKTLRIRENIISRNNVIIIITAGKTQEMTREIKFI